MIHDNHHPIWSIWFLQVPYQWMKWDIKTITSANFKSLKVVSSFCHFSQDELLLLIYHLDWDNEQFQGLPLGLLYCNGSHYAGQEPRVWWGVFQLLGASKLIKHSETMTLSQCGLTDSLDIYNMNVGQDFITWLSHTHPNQGIMMVFVSLVLVSSQTLDSTALEIFGYFHLCSA